MYKTSFMKKGVLAFLAVLFTAGAHAQFGIKGGVNVSNYTFRQNGVELERDALVGYNLGLFYRTQGGFLGVQPALTYTVKGARRYYPNPAVVGYDYANNKLHYVQFALPITLQFPIPGAYWGAAFDIGAGPYVSALIDANSVTHNIDGTETKEDYPIGNRQTDYFRPGDAGINLLMGVKFHRVGFYLGYDAGLMDVAPAANEKIFNRNFTADLHVFF